VNSAASPALPRAKARHDPKIDHDLDERFFAPARARSGSGPGATRTRPGQASIQMKLSTPQCEASR
jgi:hypothetical protein